MLVTFALVALSAARQSPPAPLPTDPTIPIPTGRIGAVGWFGGAELTTQLLFRFTWGYREDEGGAGREMVWRAGGLSGAWDAISDAGEVTRTTRLKRTSPGPGPGEVTRSELFISNAYATIQETYQTRWGRVTDISYWWYPVEGVGVYAGFDLSRLDFYAGIRVYP